MAVTNAQILEALDTHGTRAKAAQALGITERRIYARLREMKERGIWNEGVYEELPPGHTLKGVSSYIDASGEIRGQWVKSNTDAEQQYQRLIEATKEAFAGEPRVPRIKAPKKGSPQLSAYVFGDPHLGMYAWGDESGADFDLQIAEDHLISATARLVDASPASETALMVNLGDFFHSDTVLNRTLKSGNVLDVDTRWSKVLRTGVRVMRTCIEEALKKHKSVHVINEIGNHDEHTSQMLTLALSMFYEKNPRVTFDDSPARFHYYPFGYTLLGITHGDTVKPDKLPGIMATDRPKEWGESKHRYWLTGHVHNQRVFEYPGCLVESFRTLAARDAWHSASGYRSGRDMQMIVYDQMHGEVERHRMDVGRVSQ